MIPTRSEYKISCPRKVLKNYLVVEGRVALKVTRVPTQVTRTTRDNSRCKTWTMCWMMRAWEQVDCTHKTINNFMMKKTMSCNSI